MTDDKLLASSPHRSGRFALFVICQLQFVIPHELGVKSLNRQMSLQEILDELPKLTEAERARLQEELDAFSQNDERAWAETTEERLRGIRAGEKKAIPAEEVFAKARNLIGE